MTEIYNASRVRRLHGSLNRGDPVPLAFDPLDLLSIAIRTCSAGSRKRAMSNALRGMTRGAGVVGVGAGGRRGGSLQTGDWRCKDFNDCFQRFASLETGVFQVSPRNIGEPQKAAAIWRFSFFDARNIVMVSRYGNSLTNQFTLIALIANSTKEEQPVSEISRVFQGWTNERRV
jgi:hypothetical protein